MFKNNFLLSFLVFLILFIGPVSVFSFNFNPIPFIDFVANSINKKVSDVFHFLVKQKDYIFNGFFDPNIYPNLEIPDEFHKIIPLDPTPLSEKNNSTNLVNIETSTLSNIEKTEIASDIKINKKEINTIPIVVLKNNVVVNDFLNKNQANGLEILNYSNLERGKESLSKLKPNSLLNKVAQLRVDDLFAKQYFDHNSPDGSTASSVATDIGYDYLLIGENLALGHFSGDEDLVLAWMNSPGHRANIMNSKFTELGVAAREGVYKGDQVLIAVQIFATPLSVCPKPNQEIKDLIDNSAITINKMQQEALAMFNNLNAIKDSPDLDLSYYNQKVQEYNFYAKKVNDAISLIKNMIINYNAEITSYNKCLNNL